MRGVTENDKKERELIRASASRGVTACAGERQEGDLCHIVVSLLFFSEHPLFPA
jgi:hypothetical protein